MGFSDRHTGNKPRRAFTCKTRLDARGVSGQQSRIPHPVRDVVAEDCESAGHVLGFNQMHSLRVDFTFDAQTLILESRLMNSTELSSACPGFLCFYRASGAKGFASVSSMAPSIYMISTLGPKVCKQDLLRDLDLRNWPGTGSEILFVG